MAPGQRKRFPIAAQVLYAFELIDDGMDVEDVHWGRYLLGSAEQNVTELVEYDRLRTVCVEE